MLEALSKDLLARVCVFASGAGDQFASTTDDMLAFGRMMSIELMIADQLTPRAEGGAPFVWQLLGLAWLGARWFDRDPARRCGRVL